jgi:hypothetical protein
MLYWIQPLDELWWLSIPVVSRSSAVLEHWMALMSHNAMYMAGGSSDNEA